MALLTPMTLAAAREVGRGYDLDVLAIEPLQVGSVNSNFRLQVRSGGPFFLRVYEEQGFAGASAELRMLSELHRIGVPTPEPLPHRDGGHAGRHEGKPVGVVPWVDGEVLCLGRVTPAVARRVGRALAEVHVASTSLSAIPEGRFGVSDLSSRLATIDRVAPSFAADTAFIRERLARYSAVPSESLPRGLIHGDLFRDNALWGRLETADNDSSQELTALIDFESASAGIFVYDLMVTVHAWCYGAKFDLTLVRALLGGYSEVRVLDEAELAALRPQGALAALRFATTRITDFSLRAPPGQAPARDFRRFLARLQALESGALDAIAS